MTRNFNLKVHLPMSIPKNSPPHDPWYPLVAAAQYVGVHPQTLRQAIREREIAASRRGDYGHYRLRLSELNRWALSHETPARKRA